MGETYNIDTTVSCDRDDGVKGSEIYTDDCAEETNVSIMVELKTECRGVEGGQWGILTTNSPLIFRGLSDWTSVEELWEGTRSDSFEVCDDGRERREKRELYFCRSLLRGVLGCFEVV